MTDSVATGAAPDDYDGGMSHDNDVRGSRQRPQEHRPPSAGPLTQYKPEQGKTTRTGSFVAVGLLIVWGAIFLKDQLAGYQGDEAWRLLITHGIPIFAAVVFGVLAWQLIFVRRSTSDFMIATEGEMKKVNWSTKAEVMGSTKVVIMFTIMLASLLFVVDLLFKALFSALDVLKIS